MRGVFVTGTDTDVGKTVLCAALMAASADTPRPVRYWKPVQTGAGLDDDTETVLRLAQLAPERVLDEGVRLRLPASPHYAALDEGTRIELAPLERLARAHGDGARWVVEGAGGLLVPLSEQHLLPDLVTALGLPLVVAASTRLGTINHTLSTLHVAASLGLEVLGVVWIGDRDPSAETALAAHSRVPVLGRLPTLDPLEPVRLREAGRAILCAAPLWARLAGS